MNLNLGLVYKSGKLINHRSLLKVFINPILRRFGYCIGTPLVKVGDTDILGMPKFIKCTPTSIIDWKGSFVYRLETNMELVKDRRIF